MENLIVKDPPEFTSEIHKTEKKEFITADLENEIKSALLNNDVFLKVLTETIQETVKQHITNGTIHVTSQDKQNWSGKAGTAVATQAADGKMEEMQINWMVTMQNILRQPAIGMIMII